MKIYKIVVKWQNGNRDYFPTYWADNEQECYDWFETELGGTIIGCTHWANAIEETA